MITFDTNLFVRLVVNDDEHQADIAEELIDDNMVFLSRTVLLETEWVLRSIYKKSRDEIASFFDSALMTKNLVIENSTEIEQALAWYKLGADFADAMHLCICGESLLHTFDVKFCKKAKEMGITPGFNILNL